MGKFFANVAAGVLKRVSSKAKDNAAGLSWWKIKYLKHLPYNRPGVYDLKGLKIHYKNGPEILHSLKEIFVDEIYNIDFTTKDPFIIDCGSNIGLAIIYLKSRYPAAKIIAFEPDKSNFELLQKNVLHNSWSNIDLHNKAIWKEDGILSFKTEGTLGSKIEEGSTDENIQKVTAVRLKNLLTRKVDFLKIDIEGAEYEVLKDCADSLFNVTHLFIEFHGYFDKMFQLTEIFEIVKKNGFAFYIKEADAVYKTPFSRSEKKVNYDLQLNIFCFRVQPQ